MTEPKIKERGILFSAPMVRALLAGTKTQTRRVAKPQPDGVMPNGTPYRFGLDKALHRAPEAMSCPYGQPVDRLWVRENGWQRPDLSQRQLREGADTWPPYEYDAEPLMCWADGELKGYGWKRRPSIHMPRWASRILLEITAVRVERLQDISESDAWAEGCAPGLATDNGGFFPAEEPDPSGIGRRGWDNARDWYADLWEDINGTGSWDANPWVWVIEFKRATP